jgi:hypothetical protein
VCQLRPLTNSFDLNNDPRFSFKLVKLRAKNIWQFKQGASRCKMVGAGFHSIAKLRTQIRNAVLADRSVFQADCHRENCHTADCYSQRTEFERGPPKAWTARMVRIRPESGGWQSAVHLRADCQGVIIVVAIRGIRARDLAIHILKSSPAILHRETTCLTHHRFLKRDFTSVKLIRSLMFKLKLYTHGLNWHTISWYYNFKETIISWHTPSILSISWALCCPIDFLAFSRAF